MGLAIAIIAGAVIFTCLLFIFVLSVLSFAGGWRKLAIVSPVPERLMGTGDKYTFQSMRLGLVNYNMCVSIEFTNEGMVISTFKPFSFMHAPFLVRFEKISGFSKGRFFSPYIVFNFEGKRIRLQGNCIDELENRIAMK